MNEMVHKTTWVLAPVALVVMLGGLVLPVLAVRPGAIRADAGPFDGSVVVPTVDETTVGEAVGLALYVVNSIPVTATEVLVWNPLPVGATYVSASGGAFPLLGAGVNDVLPAMPPDGFAYDPRLHASVPLTDTNNVAGIAWVGDVLPGEMVSLGLIVTVDNPAGRFLVDEMFVYDDRELAGQFRGETWVRPYTDYLPLVANQAEPPIPTPTPTPVPTATVTTVTFTIPYGDGLGFGGGSIDEDYWQALAGSDLNFGDDNTFLGQSPPDGPYIPWYLISRIYAGWDTSALPSDSEVLSATLVLEVGCNPPEAAFGVSVYRGLWAPPLTADAWYQPANDLVGTWNTASYPCSGHIGFGQVFIALDPMLVNRGGLTTMEIRSDQEGVPPTGYDMIRVSRSPQFPALVISYKEEP